MAYINVAEWSSDQVTDWLKGKKTVGRGDGNCWGQFCFDDVRGYNVGLGLVHVESCPLGVSNFTSMYNH